MPKPLIGITSFRVDHTSKTYKHIAVTEAYVRAVYAAGALPVLIPLGIANDDLDAIHQRLDGVLFTGGGDMNPAEFDGEAHPTIAGVDPDRDRVEIHLVKQVVAGGTPFLGICRGLQVINVALGGTLYTHVMDQHPQSIKHDYWPNHPRDRISHPVQVDEGTALAKIMGEPILQVNSLHHQGIRKLAPGLKANAHAPDGLIEAIEVDAAPYGVAVQWHPEWLFGEHSQPQLFQSFVAAANGK